MKIFRCQSCGQVVYFENTQCMNCGTTLGFLPERLLLSALAPADHGRWRALATQPDSRLYRMCRNYTGDQVCNWMVPDEGHGDFCRACRFNRTIPDLNVPGNKSLWRKLEVGKHRLIYNLLRLGLPLASRQEDPQAGLAFAFLGDPDPVLTESERSMTGHAQGLITIDIAEADEAVREQRRQALAEPYRSLLGHFRHESGHYYWFRLARDPRWLVNFRTLFGDERQDYGTAMDRYYRHGPPPGWQSRFVSAYATAHPWEDWAESWAHYLHIVDVLETAWVFRMRVSPGGNRDESMHAEPDFDPYRADSFARLIDYWLPLTYAVNSLNRSIGLPDFYPFVLPPAALSRLRFVHDSVRGEVARPV